MSTELIELGLSRPPAAQRVPDLRPLLANVVERLRNLFDEIVTEAERDKSAEFRTHLEKSQARIIDAPSNDAAESLLRACLDSCHEHFKRARRYSSEREAELSEVIKVLRGGLTDLAGEANDFHGDLLSTTDRFQQMTNLEDLRQLRSAIAQEVSALRKVVAEKQKRDQINFSRLERRIDGLQSKLSKVKEEATIDPLTRVANRGSFDATLKRWVADLKGSDTPFVLAMLDVDNFKMINDTHGHQIGDRVLVCAAQWLSTNVRGEDMVSRYGGEEFAVLLVNLKLKQAESKFAALLGRIAESSYQYNKGSQLSVVRFTFSCGLTEFAAGDTPETVIGRADEALYAAKRNGKNQVKVKTKRTRGNFFGG